MRRHDLVRVSPAGWRGVLARDWDAEARACLEHWVAHDLPLVVARQTSGQEPGLVALGLPAPTRWSRRRIALRLPGPALLPATAFPAAEAIAPLLPGEACSQWDALCGALAGLPVRTLVCGGYGWQRMTGLVYLREGSDIDLLVEVPDAQSADKAAHVLAASGMMRPRLDGELLFPSGAAVSWREWSSCRAGQVSAVLVKHFDRVALQAAEALA